MLPACNKFTPLNEFQLSAVIRKRVIGTSLKSDVPWENDSDMCVICLGDMVAGEEVSDMPHCDHTFHLQCITQWLDSKVRAMEPGRCPTCNSLVISPAFIVESEPTTQTQEAIQVEPALGGFRFTFACTAWGCECIAIGATIVLISMIVIIIWSLN
jgi:hypothetical protein